ncbi:MAG TPA: TlpA disulfide reductase family protein [Bauldia sp.]|nr:TlpA disulfide reductase family protein [Bauldia sp.]
MNDTRPKTRRTWLLLGLAAVAGAIAGLAGVYFMESGTGNGNALADCAPAVATASRLAPLAHGDAAAFQVATGPEKLADLAFNGPDGKPLTVSAFAGKTVLLNVWATWCVPCRLEMPALDRLEAAEGKASFQVVAVNIDQNGVDRARAFLAEIGIKDLAFYSDASMGLFTQLRGRGLVLGLPTTFLIDGRGCKVGAVAGPMQWDSRDARALIEASRQG